MKQSTFTKLYSTLTNAERAALVFSNACRRDGAEIDRIVSSIPIKRYEMPDIEYTLREEGINFMSMFYGILYWRLYCGVVAGIGVIYYDESDERCTEEAKEEAFRIVKEKEGAMLGLDGAMLALCAELHLNPDDVRLFTGAKPVVTVFNKEPDEQYQAFAYDALRMFALQRWGRYCGEDYGLRFDDATDEH